MVTVEAGETPEAAAAEAAEAQAEVDRDQVTRALAKRAERTQTTDNRWDGTSGDRHGTTKPTRGTNNRATTTGWERKANRETATGKEMEIGTTRETAIGKEVETKVTGKSRCAHIAPGHTQIKSATPTNTHKFTISATYVTAGDTMIPYANPPTRKNGP